MICGTIAACGFIILIASRDSGLSYVATFLCAIGIYPCVPNTIAWFANNIEGVYKRAVTIAIIVCAANLNGIVSSNIYRGYEAPYYTLGHSVLLGYIVILLLGGYILNYTLLKRGNKKRDAGGESLRARLLSGLTPEEEAELVDFHPDFRYTL
jgi:hypothetical protein